MKSPIASKQRDRRLVFALFLAATFGMMLVLSFPLIRFLPRPDRIPGLLGLPSFVDPFRPLLPPPPAAPPEDASRVEFGASGVVVPIPPPDVVGSAPGPAPETAPPTVVGRTAPDCSPHDSTGRKGDRKGRVGKGPSAKNRAGVAAARRCRLTSPPADDRETNGPAWTVPRRNPHGGRTVTKHGQQRHAEHGHHKPKKSHKPKGK